MPDQIKPWLKHWPKQTPKHIFLPKITLQEILYQSAKKHPLKTAIVCGEKELTYVELDAQSNRFAESLVNLGIRKGDRVAVFLPNIPEFVISYFGILKAGAVASTVSPQYREREVQYQLADSGAKAVVTSDYLLDIVKNVWDTTNICNIIVTSLHSQESIAVPNEPNIWSFQRLIQEAPASVPVDLEINPQKDLAVLQYTGGTTGIPKGAMLTHSNLVSNALAFAAWIGGKQAEETFLAALPLFHIYGMTTSLTVPVSLAAKMVLLPKFEVSKALEAIQKHNVSVFCGVPTMYSSLLANSELDRYDLRSIRVCISGASSLPSKLQKRFLQATGGLLVEGYGLTEASPVTHCNPVDTTLQTVKVGSIGLPLPDTQAIILDLETRKPLAVGETGELAIKGPQVMKGYWHQPEETAAVFHEGWLLTGDIAQMDSDGYFYITDRKKDLIKTNGYSVYPRELEDILYEHPSVKQCTVVGKPDSRSGETPSAYVVLKEGAMTSPEALMAFVNDKVAPYKAIRQLELTGELPMNSAGKVLRRLLSQEEKRRNP